MVGEGSGGRGGVVASGLVGGNTDAGDCGAGDSFNFSSDILSGRAGGSLSLVTWNCACLLGGAPVDERGRRRQSGKERRIVDLALKCDVVLLQEVHGTHEDLASIKCLIPGHLVCGSFCDSRGAGGVVIIVHPRLRSRFGDSWSVREVFPGRAVILDLGINAPGAVDSTSRLDILSFCCVHVVPAWSDSVKRNFFLQLRDAVPRDSDSVFYVGGDFNFPSDGEGRLNIASGRVVVSNDPVASFFEALFEDLTEIAQDRPTRKRVEGGEVTVLSRIDRIFSSIPPGELLGRNANAVTIGKLTAKSDLSDHIPVAARICSRELLSTGRSFVPCWFLFL